MSQAVLELTNASIFQKENLILDDVSIRIEKGEFVYLIGKTGTGKSSFMKTLYGDLPLSKGDGTIVGYDLGTLKENDIPFLRRKLGVVFQDFKLLNDRTVKDNLLFVLTATGWKDKKEMNLKIDQVLDKSVSITNPSVEVDIAISTKNRSSEGEKDQISIIGVNKSQRKICRICI